MGSTTELQAAVSPAPAEKPRLRLQPDQSGYALLDGAWWPRSADLAAELPGLVPALDDRHGRITRIMLGTADWTAERLRFRTSPDTHVLGVRVGRPASTSFDDRLSGTVWVDDVRLVKAAD